VVVVEKFYRQLRNGLLPAEVWRNQERNGGVQVPRRSNGFPQAGLRPGCPEWGETAGGSNGNFVRTTNTNVCGAQL